MLSSRLSGPLRQNRPARWGASSTAATLLDVPRGDLQTLDYATLPYDINDSGTESRPFFQGAKIKSHESFLMHRTYFIGCYFVESAFSIDHISRG
jgi:hypothetical protein